MRGRAYTAGHPDLAGCGIGRLPGNAGRGAGHIGGPVGAAILGLRQGVGAERVGLDDIGPGLYVCLVDAPDEFRMREIEHLRIAMPILLRWRLPLDHGAHSAVQHKDTAGYFFLNGQSYFYSALRFRAIWSSSSCTWSIWDGESIMTSRPWLFLGKAM